MILVYTLLTLLIMLVLVLERSWVLFTIIMILAMVGILSKRRRSPLTKPHRRRFVPASYNNPAGNVLPYFRMEDARHRLQEPALSTKTKGFLLQGLPAVPKEDQVWGKRFGFRETIPVDHVPDKAGFTSFTYKEMTSCKEDRTQCLPIPNAAISSAFAS